MQQARIYDCNLDLKAVKARKLGKTVASIYAPKVERAPSGGSAAHEVASVGVNPPLSGDWPAPRVTAPDRARTLQVRIQRWTDWQVYEIQDG